MASVAPAIRVPLHYRQGEHEKLWLNSAERIAAFGKLFGSYRTLRLMCREGEFDSMDALLPSMREKFAISAIDTQDKENHWYDITIDQDRTKLSDVLSWALNTLPVKDVQIQEIKTESVIAKVYAGGK